MPMADALFATKVFSLLKLADVLLEVLLSDAKTGFGWTEA